MIAHQDVECIDFGLHVIAKAVDESSQRFLAWVEYDVVEDAAVNCGIWREGSELVVSVTVQFGATDTEGVVWLDESHRFPADMEPAKAGDAILARLIEVHAGAFSEGDLAENVARVRAEGQRRGFIPFGDMMVALGRGIDGIPSIYEHAKANDLIR